MLSLKRLERELEDVRQELMGLPLIAPDCRIADFGCGYGYAIMSLMLELDAVECIGVDSDENKWQLPTIGQAQEYFKVGKDNFPKDNLSARLSELLERKRWPTFQRADILTSENLPKNLDIAYCKSLLGNLPQENGHLILNRTINNIVDCLKQGGILCVVDKNNYSNFIQPPILGFLRLCQIRRAEITFEGERRQMSVPAYVHLYRKR